MYKTSIIGGLVMGVAHCVPAAASTMPRVDFAGGESYVAVGVLDANFDRVLDGAWSIGGTTSIGAAGNMAFGPPLSFGIRATRRLGGGPRQLSWGLTFAGGFTPSQTYVAAAVITPGVAPPTAFQVPWFQSALVASLPLGFVTLRGSVGPVFSGQDRDSIWGWQVSDGGRQERARHLGDPLYFLPSSWNLFMPGFEVAFPIGTQHEVTLLGNSLIGWRGTF